MTAVFESYQPIFAGSRQYRVQFAGFVGQDVAGYLRSLPGYAPGKVLTASEDGGFEWTVSAAPQSVFPFTLPFTLS